MGNIFRGNTALSKVYRGQTELSKVYRGQTEIWSSAVIPTSPVTDTSVILLDATNPSSYPGSGTTWTDLSGQGNNADVNLITPYWDASGWFDFPGTDYTKVATVAYNSSLQIFDGDFTVLLVGTIDATGTGTADNSGPFGIDEFTDNPGTGWLINRLTGGSAVGGMNYYLNSSAVGFSGAGNTLFTNIGDWFVAHIVRSGSTINYYKTDNTSIFSATNSTNGNSTNGIVIGRGRFHSLYNYRYNGKIAGFALYDKALSSAERLQNINYFANKLGF